MILFSCEYYSRLVIGFRVPVMTESHNHHQLHTIDTITILTLKWNQRKWTIRFRIWPDRVGLEWKYASTLADNLPVRCSIQEKLGFYLCSFYGTYLIWWLTLLRFKHRKKQRQVVIMDDLRITIDEHSRWEMKFHVDRARMRCSGAAYRPPDANASPARHRQIRSGEG